MSKGIKMMVIVPAEDGTEEENEKLWDCASNLTFTEDGPNAILQPGQAGGVPCWRLFADMEDFPRTEGSDLVFGGDIGCAVGEAVKYLQALTGNDPAVAERDALGRAGALIAEYRAEKAQEHEEGGSHA